MVVPEHVASLLRTISTSNELPVVEGVSESQVRQFSGYFRDWAEHNRLCQTCPGLEACPIGGRRIRWERNPADEIVFVLGSCPLRIAHEKRKRMEELIKASRLTEAQKKRTFETFEVTEENKTAYEACKAIAKGQRKKGVILCGSTGNGKSHLALAILNELLAKGRSGVFVTVPELLEEIRRSFDSKNDGKLMEAVNTTPFLVLDDLGVEKASEWTTERLFMILTNRLNAEAMTVFTTNLGKNELGARFAFDEKIQAGRIISRLEEMCDWILVKGEDRRMPARRQIDLFHG